MSQKLKTLKEKLRQAIYLELLEYDNLNTRKEKELEERINLFVEKNTPTNPSKWSYYKSQAKKKFDVYPSAYANAWAAKQYKAAGGGWRKSENIEEASMTGNLDGGEGPPKTPYAFQSKKKRGQDKKKEDEISTNSTGFTKVNEGVLNELTDSQWRDANTSFVGNKYFPTMLKTVKKIIQDKDEKKLEVFIGANYRYFKNMSKNFKFRLKEALNDSGVKEFKRELAIDVKYVKALSKLINKKSVGKATEKDDQIISSLTNLLQGRFSGLANMLKNKNLNEVTNKEINALRSLVNGIGKLKKDFSKATYIGDKELRKRDYNKHYETLLKAEKAMVKLMQLFRNKQMLGEGRYHQWRNDESLSPKQKIGRSMREVRDSLNGLSKTIDMSVRLKNELKVDTTDYWKTTHKALGKISERLVKLANKVGKLQ